MLGGDHRLFVDALAVAISREGVTVAARASTPQEVMAEVSRHEPDICLLVAHSPNSSSLDVLRAISVHYPRVRVLILSENSDPAIVTAAIDSGAAGFIKKNENITKLIDTLPHVLAGERALDADSARPQFRTVSKAAAAVPEHMLRMLTVREHEVLLLLMEGAGAKQIARSLAISVSTARTHVQSVLAKLGAHSRLEASSMVARSGLLDTLGSYPLSPAARAEAASGLPRLDKARSWPGIAAAP